MKLSSLNIVSILVWYSVSATVAKPLSDSNDEGKSNNGLREVESSALQIRQGPAVPFEVAGGELIAGAAGAGLGAVTEGAPVAALAVIGGVLYGQLIISAIHDAIVNNTEVNIDPDQGTKSESATGILQKQLDLMTVDQKKKGSVITGIAIRFGVPIIPLWGGVPGKDWGTLLFNIHTPVDPSSWLFYWVTTGVIDVQTFDLAHDVIIGGSDIITPGPSPGWQRIQIVSAGPK